MSEVKRASRYLKEQLDHKIKAANDLLEYLENNSKEAPHVLCLESEFRNLIYEFQYAHGEHLAALNLLGKAQARSEY